MQIIANEKYSFALNINTMKYILAKLINKEPLNRGYLNLSLNLISLKTAESAYNLKNETISTLDLKTSIRNNCNKQLISISSIYSYPSTNNTLQKNDIILKIDNTIITNDIILFDDILNNQYILFNKAQGRI